MSTCASVADVIGGAGRAGGGTYVYVSTVACGVTTESSVSVSISATTVSPG
jgi:hypothetical protein